MIPEIRGYNSSTANLDLYEHLKPYLSEVEDVYIPTNPTNVDTHYPFADEA